MAGRFVENCDRPGWFEVRPPIVSHPKLAIVFLLSPSPGRRIIAYRFPPPAAPYIAIQYEPRPSWRLPQVPPPPAIAGLSSLTRPSHVRSIDFHGLLQACHRQSRSYSNIPTNDSPYSAARHMQIRMTTFRQHPPLRRLLRLPRDTGGTETLTGL